MVFFLLLFSCKENVVFKDKAGKEYNTIKIGNQIWMAENLAYKPEKGNFWVYDNNEENIEKYGYLYDLKAAQVSCPDGWHLPTKSDFENLLEYCKTKTDKNPYYFLTSDSLNFIDAFGGFFTGKFYKKDTQALFLSSTINAENTDETLWHLSIRKKDKIAVLNFFRSKDGLSVRYVKNN